MQSLIAHNAKTCDYVVSGIDGPDGGVWRMLFRRPHSEPASRS